MFLTAFSGEVMGYKHQLGEKYDIAQPNLIDELFRCCLLLCSFSKLSMASLKNVVSLIKDLERSL